MFVIGAVIMALGACGLLSIGLAGQNYDEMFAGADIEGATKKARRDPTTGQAVITRVRANRQVQYSDRRGNILRGNRRRLTKADFGGTGIGATGSSWASSTASTKSLIGTLVCPQGMRISFPRQGGNQNPYKRFLVKLVPKDGATSPAVITTGTFRAEVVDAAGRAKGDNVLIDDTPLQTMSDADTADVQKKYFLENESDISLGNGDKLLIWLNADVATAMVYGNSNIYLDALVESIQNS
jgi:hypothetical protein